MNEPYHFYGIFCDCKKSKTQNAVLYENKIILFLRAVQRQKLEASTFV